jgi:hypothetical protein
MKKQSRRKVPAFATEAEEAEWWFQNRKVHENQLVAAANTGEAQILTREKLSRLRKRDCLTRPILSRCWMRRWWRGERRCRRVGVPRSRRG